MGGSWYARRELELALLVVLAGLAAGGVSAALRLAVDTLPPPAPVVAPSRIEPLEAYAPIAARDLFNGPTAVHGNDGHLRLVGVGFQGGDARAAVEDASTHRQTLVRVGDALGDARVSAIAWDHVVLATARGETVLDLVPPAAAHAEPASDTPTEPTTGPAAAGSDIRQTSPTGFVVDRRALDGAVSDLSGLMTQVRAVADVQEGRPAGFRLFQMKEDSIFRRLGLQNGDVVQHVNGQAVSDPATLLGFLQRLKSEPRVALDIRRGTERQTLVYDLR